jgi:hypothetical protein
MARRETPKQEERLGCLAGLIRSSFRLLLRMLGIGGREVRSALIPMDETYREFVDTWVSETMARWLNQTRPDIDVNTATKILLGEADRHPSVARTINDTLIDAKVTFLQRNGKQFLQIEAYMAPRQVNGKMPQILRWTAEREIAWQEIPDDVRERLIRMRKPVTLGYAMPR